MLTVEIGAIPASSTEFRDSAAVNAVFETASMGDKGFPIASEAISLIGVALGPPMIAEIPEAVQLPIFRTILVVPTPASTRPVAAQISKYAGSDASCKFIRPICEQNNNY